MIRAVLDVNVLVSGFAAREGTPSDIIESWTDGDFELVISEHILSGLTRAWSKPYYATRYSRDAVQRALGVLREGASIVMPDHTVRGIGNDTEDDLVLATAVAGRVSHLVTGDKGLLRLVQYRGIEIVSPRAFLDLLQQP